MGQAAKIIHLSRWQALRILELVHQRNPGLRLLKRSGYGGRGGNWRVCPMALGRFADDEDGIRTSALEERVGLLESRMETQAARIGTIEKKLNQHKSCCETSPASH